MPRPVGEYEKLSEMTSNLDNSIIALQGRSKLGSGDQVSSVTTVLQGALL